MPTPNPPDFVGTTPIQTLYHIETQVLNQGWNAQLHEQAAFAHMQLNDLPGAIAHWEAIDPATPTTTQQLAQAYFQMGRWQDAVDAYQQLLLLEPGHVTGHYQLGLIIAASSPGMAVLHFEIAARDRRFSQLTGALAAAIDIEESRRDPTLSAFRVGQVFAQHDLWPYAEQAFRYAGATSYVPLPEALAYVGLARLNQGKPGGDAIEFALQFGEDSPPVQYVYGIYLREEGAFEASRRAFARAVALDPDNPLYYAELGTAYRLLLDYEIAEYWLRVAVVVSENDPVFEQRLAVFYAEEGYQLTPDRLTALQETSGVVPEDPELLAGFGWALHTMGDSIGGLNEIEAALALAPEHPLALYNKARILVATNNTPAALPLLRRLADGNSPYAESAQLLLVEIESD